MFSIGSALLPVTTEQYLRSGLFGTAIYGGALAYTPYKPLPPVTVPKPRATSPEGIQSDSIKDLPLILRSLPLTELEISLGFEDHPSGNLKLLATDTTIAAVRRNLQNGTRLNLWGIGFETANYQESQSPRGTHPGGRYEISISLAGAQERAASRPLPYADTAQAIAAAAGYVVKGPPMRVQPTAAPSPGDSTTLAQEVEEHTRINKSFVDYTLPQEIVVRDIDQVNSWVIPAQDVRSGIEEQFSLAASPRNLVATGLLPPPPTAAQPSSVTAAPATTPQPEATDWIPKPEYQNFSLSGLFSDPDSRDSRYGRDDPTKDSSEPKEEREDTQANNEPRPSWNLVPPDTITLASGDLSPALAPGGASVRTVDSNFDKSGPTKEFSFVTTVKGVTISEQMVRYGFFYLARDDGASWGVIENVVTTYSYDSKGYQPKSTQGQGRYVGGDTSYLTRISGSGERLGRFKEEDTESPESLALDPDSEEDAKELALYEFRAIPVRTATLFQLAPHSSYFDDLDEGSAYVEYEYTDRAGNEQTEYILDPNFKPSYFVSAESTETMAFISTENPQSTKDDPLPPLITGLESYNRRFVDVTSTKPDIYREYQGEFSAQDGNFANSAEKKTFSEHSGKPPQGSSMEMVYERVKPEDEDPDPPQDETEPNNDRDSSIEYEYFVNTPGHSINSPSAGSLSFPAAPTVAAALVGAKTALRVEDINGTLSTNLAVRFNPGLRPMDKLTLYAGPQIKRRRLINISHRLSLSQGRATGTTDITCGIDRVVGDNVVISSRIVPKPPEPSKPRKTPRPKHPNNTPSSPPPTPKGSAVIGFLLAGTRSRRNF